MVSKLDDRLSRGHEIIGDIMIQPAQILMVDQIMLMY